MPDLDAPPARAGRREPAARRAPRWPALLPVVLPAVAVLALLPRLGSPPLWRDEVMTQVAATKDLPALLTMLLQRTDATSGLHYLLLRPVAGVTLDPFWWRLPSLLGVVVAVAVVGLTARRAAGTAAGVLAGGVLLADPAVWWAAAEARPYGLALGAAAVTVHLLLGVRRGAGHPVLFAAAAVVSVHLHAVSALVVAALVAVLAVPGLDLDRRRLLRAAAVAAVLCVPLAVLVGRQSGAQTAWVPLLRDVRRWADLPRDLLGGSWTAGVLAVVVAVGAVAALLPVLRRWADRRGASTTATATAVVVCSCAVVLPVVALTAASVVAHVFVPRYLLVVLPPLAVLVGTGLARLDRGPRVVVLVVLLALAGSGWWRAAWGGGKPDDPAAAARWVASQDAAGDVVVHDPGWLRAVVGTELARTPGVEAVDPAVDPGLDAASWPDLYLPERSPDAVLTALDAAARVWVVSKPGDGWNPTRDSAARAWRAATAVPGAWSPVEHRAFGELEVTLYERTGRA